MATNEQPKTLPVLFVRHVHAHLAADGVDRVSSEDF